MQDWFDKLLLSALRLALIKTEFERLFLSRGAASACRRQNGNGSFARSFTWVIPAGYFSVRWTSLRMTKLLFHESTAESSQEMHRSTEFCSQQSDAGLYKPCAACL